MGKTSVSNKASASKLSRPQSSTWRVSEHSRGKREKQVLNSRRRDLNAYAASRESYAFRATLAAVALMIPAVVFVLLGDHTLALLFFLPSFACAAVNQWCKGRAASARRALSE